MDIKIDLVISAISKAAIENHDKISIDADQITDTAAIAMWSEIQKIIQDVEISDFDAIEKIVILFEKYYVDAGARHDFG